MLRYWKLGVLALFAVMLIGLVPACSAIAYVRFDSADASGNVVDLFNVGNEIWAKAIGYTPGTVYTVSVVSDIDPWDDQTVIVPVSPSVTATVGSDGSFLVKVWSEAQPGMYDIVADKQGVGVAGKYDKNIDLVDNDDIGVEVDTAGLLVVPEYILGGLAAVGAAFAAFAVIKRKTIHF